MKKSIFFLALLASLGGCLQAQDTLWQKAAPMDNYFYNTWIDTNEPYVGGVLLSGHTFATAKRFIAKDTMKVYGIAAMMINERAEYPSYSDSLVQAIFNATLPDPTLNNCEESLLLFQYHGGTPMPMQQLGDSLHVHALHTPASYFLKLRNIFSIYWDTFPKPVYERYFQSPQTVYDTFYAGYTVSHQEFNEQGKLCNVRPYLGCMAFMPAYTYHLEIVADLVQDESYNPRVWECNNTTCGHAYFIFPILTPDPNDSTGITPVNPDDSTGINPGDTLAVRSPALLDRYTAAFPNPASDKVSVVSSFGLSRIEAFDAQGRLVYNTTCPPSLSASLDVSSWPRGSYLLRIHTPAGTTTKKLLVQ